MPNRRKSPEQRKASGADRVNPGRAVVWLYPDWMARADPATIDPPKWLPRGAKAIFREKVEVYRRRGQKVEGFEHALAVYCQLEWMIRDASWKGVDLPMSMVTQWRILAGQFFDTPHAGGTTIPDRSGNPFAKHGWKPPL